MTITPYTIAIFLWLVFIVYWQLSSHNTKHEVYRQPLLTRVAISVGFALAAVLMFWQRLSVGWLGLVLFPQNFVTALIGILIGALGLILAILARQKLGENWSDGVSLREGHELIQSGPYRLVRHPIYLGVLLLVLGTAVVLGEVRSFLAILIFLFSITLRIRDEDRILSQQFPQEFEAYKKTTKMLIPWLF